MAPLGKNLNRRIGRAMHDYAMLAEGDRVLLAVSGGIDSLVLAWILRFWQDKAPIAYHLQAAHVDMETTKALQTADLTETHQERSCEQAMVLGPTARTLTSIFAAQNLHLHVLPARWQPPRHNRIAQDAGRDLCFQCARSRRTQLFEQARRSGCNKIAFGHHRDDIIETFLLNLTCAGNISTMLPRQELFSGRLSVIRPLAYLDKAEVEELGHSLGLQPLGSSCPLAERTRRQDMHQLAQHIYAQIPNAKKHIFAALGNVRGDYLLRQKPLQAKPKKSSASHTANDPKIGSAESPPSPSIEKPSDAHCGSGRYSW